MDIHGPGIPGSCIFLECGDFAITFNFVPSKQRCYTNTGLSDDTGTLTRSQETEDTRMAVTGMDHK
jgi:hypothetical protein